GHTTACRGGVDVPDGVAVEQFAQGVRAAHGLADGVLATQRDETLDGLGFDVNLLDASHASSSLERTGERRGFGSLANRAEPCPTGTGAPGKRRRGCCGC